MSVSYEQIQKYAEAVGGELVKNALRGGYDLFYPDGYCLHADTLVPIKESLAAKYRELAEQAQEAFETHMKLKYPNQNAAIKQEINQSHYLRAIADSLSEPEEPTQPTILQQLEQRRAGKFDPYGLNLILDALIELYKAKE